MLSDAAPLEVIVIGGGQAGLAVGYHLQRRGVRFLILDASERIGDSWRKRWDSLRLFTPAWLDGLDGLRFPAPDHYFPTKDEMADYLESYAQHFGLPVRGGVKVERVSREGERYRIETSGGSYLADQVIVAMSNYQRPKVPAFAKDLAPDVVQIHSSRYKSPSQLRPGTVLIAGAGNSGAEIGCELRKHGHSVLLAGRDTGHAPFRMDGFWGRWLLCRLLLRVVFHRILTIRTPIGRNARPRIIKRGGPLIRQQPQDLAAMGVERVARIAAVKDGQPELVDGQRLEIANVIWCTGFESGLGFLELPIFDEAGEPRHEAGVVPGERLYFVGQHFQYAMSSTMIHGVSRDANQIASVVQARRSPRS